MTPGQMIILHKMVFDINGSVKELEKLRIVATDLAARIHSLAGELHHQRYCLTSYLEDLGISGVKNEKVDN